VLEKELAGLIVDGQITARIDSQAKVLYARYVLVIKKQTVVRVVTATVESSSAYHWLKFVMLYRSDGLGSRVCWWKYTVRVGC
jgi:hypothetical protein